jgi:hypothetical protein
MTARKVVVQTTQLYEFFVTSRIYEKSSAECAPNSQLANFREFVIPLAGEPTDNATSHSTRQAKTPAKSPVMTKPTILKEF